VSFAEELRQKYAQIWEAQKNHPFVRGIGDGTLPLDNFRYYMRQDFLFLVDYCRASASAVAKAETLEDMQYFSQGLDATLNTEMSLHIGFCEDLQITEEELRATEPSPTTLAYTSHLLRAASQGDAGEIAAAMLPCAWGYAEIGRALFNCGMPEGQPLYHRWIEMYVSDEYVADAEKLKSFVDRSGERAGPVVRQRMDLAFRLGSQYEYQFWDAALRMEGWGKDSSSA